MAGVELVLVSLSDVAQVQALVNSSGIQLPILITPQEGDFERDYRIPGTPAFCMLNASGKVHISGVAGTTPEWRKLIESWEREAKHTPIRVSLERR